MASITALGIGSGLDLNGLLDQLRLAERARLEPFTQQQKNYESKISAYGRLEGTLSQLHAAVESLGQASRYSGALSKVEGSSISAAAGNGAALGSYSVNVTGLARAYSIATAGIADKTADLGGATITLELADGTSTAVEIDAGSSSLEDIRDAINTADAGVRASILHDGGSQPYRLVLASENTGTLAAIAAVDFGGLAGQLALDPATELAGQDASLTVNGVAITSASNQVEGAIEGVSLRLQETGVSTLTVERDVESVENAVKAFVSAYNRLQDTMAQLSRFDGPGGQSGELLGDTLLRGVKSQLRAVLGGVFGDGDLRLAADAGLQLRVDGTIELDGERLATLAKNELGALAEFLSDPQHGLAARMDAVLDPVLDEGGSLDRAEEGLEALIDRLGERQLRVERSIEETVARYRKQFADMDRMLAGMNATSDYLFQQFDIMNAQLGRK